MDAAIVAQIDARLAEVRRQHGVAIPLAIESGSRAWGFPSPDSDYDCRFIFVRPANAYLSPWLQRDVIETPLDKIFDVNGWDLAKALKLLLKGNAVVVEWLMSPIAYDVDAQFRSAFLRLARQVADRQRTARHYLHLGLRQRRTYFGDDTSVAQKKIFYALRPAAALRWLRLHPDARVPPMHFPTLMRQCDAPREVRALVEDLIRRKAETRDLEHKPLPRSLARFIDGEFERAAKHFDDTSAPDDGRAKQLAESFFRIWVQRLHRRK